MIRGLIVSSVLALLATSASGQAVWVSPDLAHGGVEVQVCMPGGGSIGITNFGPLFLVSGLEIQACRPGGGSIGITNCWPVRTVGDVELQACTPGGGSIGISQCDPIVLRCSSPPEWAPPLEFF